jgi:hypothetical protein
MGQMCMTDREKLIELLDQCDRCNAEYCNQCEFGKDIDGCVLRQKEIIADTLLANGVTVRIKIEKPPTDLTGKCGGCVFAKPTTCRRATCCVECTNEDRLSRWKYEYMKTRQRTHKACKSYIPLPEPPKEN